MDMEVKYDQKRPEAQRCCRVAEAIAGKVKRTRGSARVPFARRSLNGLFLLQSRRTALLLGCAGPVAKLENAVDFKSADPAGSCEFESHQDQS